jgi:hypothetical protein
MVERSKRAVRSALKVTVSIERYVMYILKSQTLCMLN